MRTWPSALLAECKGPAPRLAQALYVRRADGTALALTSADLPGAVSNVPIGGAVEGSVTFSPLPHGVQFSAWARTAGTDVDNAEAFVYHGQTPVLTLPGVLDRRWHAAPWVAGLYCWAHPEYGFGALACGVVGQIKQRVSGYAIELRDLRQLLNGNPTPLTQKACLWTLGSNSERDGFCRKDLAAYTFTAVPVTGVTSSREFAAASLAGQPADAFGNGVLTWTTGLNAGRQVRILAFTAGTFVLEEEMVQGIAPADQFTAVYGCRLRYEEDCIAKFDNGINFGGFPHNPGPDKALNPKGMDTAAPPPPADPPAEL